MFTLVQQKTMSMPNIYVLLTHVQIQIPEIKEKGWLFYSILR